MPLEKRLSAKRMRKFKTPAERMLWDRIRRRALGAKFRCQAPMWGYIADFYAPQYALCIEVDGEYHEPCKDALRDRHLEEKGIATIRFTNEQVVSNIDAVLREIRAAIIARSGAVVKRVRRASVEKDGREIVSR
jgi:very-short-patch-repair endonuclease